MDKRRRKQPKTTSYCCEEVSSIEWEFINMSEQEEDLIYRMYKLVGDSISRKMIGLNKNFNTKPVMFGELSDILKNFRWALIAGRIPGRKAEEIERFWIMRHGDVFADRRKELRRRHNS